MVLDIYNVIEKVLNINSSTQHYEFYEFWFFFRTHQFNDLELEKISHCASYKKYMQLKNDVKDASCLENVTFLALWSGH